MKRMGCWRKICALLIIFAILVVPVMAGTQATGSLQAITRGESLYIEGYAHGSPGPGVAIWIFGFNFYQRETQYVESDGRFTYELPGAATARMNPGQYFVVVQHPMMNDRFDVVEDTTTTPGTTYVRIRGTTGISGGDVFIAEGPGRLQSASAAEALIRLLDSQTIDDTYMRMNFRIEEPWITITPISPVYAGRTFEITGTTNLAPGSNLIIEIISSAFDPGKKEAQEIYAGTSGIVSVVQGEADINSFSFSVDTTAFKPDGYIVTVESIEPSHMASATFYVIEYTETPREPEIEAPATPKTTPEPIAEEEVVKPEPEETPVVFAPLLFLIVGVVLFICGKRKK